MLREKTHLPHPVPTRSRHCLALLVLLALLAACGPAGGGDGQTLLGGRTPQAGNKGADARASSTPPPSPTPVVSRFNVTAEQLRGLTVNVWHPWIGEQGEGFTDLLNEFNRSNP